MTAVLHVHLAVFGYQESLGRWLVSTDHVQNQVINWAINATLTLVLLGMVVRPAGRWARREWRTHRAAQHRLAEAQERVADLLDTSTPGGLTDVLSALQTPGRDET